MRSPPRVLIRLKNSDMFSNRRIKQVGVGWLRNSTRSRETSSPGLEELPVFFLNEGVIWSKLLSTVYWFSLALRGQIV